MKPRTEAARVLHKTDHGDPCPFEPHCALVNDGPWGKAALIAIEEQASEAASGGLDADDIELVERALQVAGEREAAAHFGPRPVIGRWGDRIVQALAEAGFRLSRSTEGSE